MKSSKMTIFSRSLRRIVTKFLMVAIVASMAIMVGCSEEVINDPYARMQEGVILPKKKAYFGAGVIRIPVTTAAGFTVDVENSEMLVVRTNSRVEKAGTYSIDVEALPSPDGMARYGAVFITVDGYSRVRLIDVAQLR